MTPAKLNVFFSWFPYGGNGSCSSEHPNLRSWFAKTVEYCKTDKRIGEIISADYSDTPIPMMRNRSVLEAREKGADVLVMVDSDQHPDLYLGLERGAKPFFASSFDFLYERKMQGMVSVIGAPYCGPPPCECVYVFHWEGGESDHPNVDHKLSMYSRELGSQMAGIQPAAGLPTGCIMFDMEAFNVTDPRHEFEELLKRYQEPRVAMALTKPWFYYEYKDINQSEKASTEDVTASRDMSLCALAKLGHNILFCNWDAWAGHWKPKCVGKPVLLTAESINNKYQEAALSGRKIGAKMMSIPNTNKAGVARTKVVCGAVNDTVTLGTNHDLH